MAFEPIDSRPLVPVGEKVSLVAVVPGASLNETMVLPHLDAALQVMESW